MGDDKSVDRAIGVASKVIDSVPTEWTDEKHRLYLNSMEASFVKQLYSRKHGSNDLLNWLSKAQVHAKSQPIGQFKVLRGGCWEKLRFESAESQAESESESHKISGNNWIQHFRSHSAAKERKSADLVDGSNLVGQSVHIINRKHRREATSRKQMHPFFSHEVHKVSVGSITEVSDQNFVDMDIERGDELSRRCRKKRARNAASQITDQVVPLVVPTSEGRSAFLHENNQERSDGNLRTVGAPETEPQFLPSTVGRKTIRS